MPRSSSAISLDTSSRTSVSASATRSSAPRSCAPTCLLDAHGKLSAHVLLSLWAATQPLQYMQRGMRIQT